MVNSTETWQRFDNKRIAVVLNLRGKQQLLLGSAAYTTDALLGNVVQIALDGGSDDEIVLILEDKWEGEIVADSPLDCDFCFRPSLTWAPG